MKPVIASAIREVVEAGVGSGVRTMEDADGGGYVVVDDVAVGGSFAPTSSWIGFHIVWAYPDADTYPHFMSPEIRYVGEQPTPNKHPQGNLPLALSRGAEMPGFKLSAIQISRRSNHRNTETDSALQKLLRVVEFLKRL